MAYPLMRKASCPSQWLHSVCKVLAPLIITVALAFANRRDGDIVHIDGDIVRISDFAMHQLLVIDEPSGLLLD
jgi:hypothetical protein